VQQGSRRLRIGGGYSSVSQKAMSFPGPVPEPKLDSDGGSSLDRWDIEELDSNIQVCTYSIEQGPIGLRLLTLCAVTTSCVNSLLVCAGVPGSSAGALRSATSGFTRILPYTVALCQIVLAFSAAVFEVDLSMLQEIDVLDQYQDFLLDRLPFLTEVLPRGLFYFLQGIVWLLFTAAEEPQHLVIVIWLSMVAVFHVCVHLQFLPCRVLAKTRRSSVDFQRDLRLEPEQEAFISEPHAKEPWASKANASSSKPQSVLVPAQQTQDAATARALVHGSASGPPRSELPARNLQLQVAKSKADSQDEAQPLAKPPEAAGPPASARPALPPNATPSNVAVAPRKQQSCCIIT